MMVSREKISEMILWVNSHRYRLLRKSELDHRLEIHDRCVGLDIRDVTNQPISESRYVVLDLETTGFSAYAGDEIVSVALLEYCGLEPTGKVFTTLVNPGRPIPEESRQVHHIGNQDVEDAPYIEDIMDDILDFIGNSVIVGHHVLFDIRFLNKVTQKHLYCRLKNPFIDTMLLYLSHSGRIGHYSLEEVAQFTRVTIKDRHSAMGDATAAGSIFSHLCKQLYSGGERVSELLDFQNQAHEHQFSL